MQIKKWNELSNLLKILIILATCWILIWFIYGNFFYDGDKEIQSIIDGITEANESNLTKGIKIIQWENDNIYNSYGNLKELIFIDPIMDRPPYIKFLALFLFRNEKNTSWIMYTKYGACGEHARLFIKMAEVSGLDSRLVIFPGEDHAIAEVKISNNLWIPMDATLPKNNISSPDPYFYENYWWGNVSRVYYLDSNNTEHDITKNYTQTGNITIKVVGESNSPNDYTVNIKSTYKGISAIKGHPDENLIFRYVLGDNSYRIIVEKKVRWGFGIFNTVDENIVILNPNESIFLEMKPEKLKINWLIFTIFILILISSVLSSLWIPKRIMSMVKDQKF